MKYRNAAANEFQTYCTKDSTGIFNHEPMRHTARVLERFKIIGQGQSLKDVPMSHGQIAYGTGDKVAKPFKYNNYRLDSNKPALKIPASYQSLFVHPIQDRNLTAREGARLMSFPDHYLFSGPKTMMSWESGLSQYNQIGNAVCPLVAKSLGHSLKTYLQELGGNDFSVSQSSALNAIYRKLNKHRYLIDDARSASRSLSGEFVLGADIIKGSRYFDDQNRQLVVGRMVVPIKNVQFAYQLLIDEQCSICSAHDAPFGKHDGSLNLLISKSDLKSLYSNKNDNGLDFHLRIFSGEDTRMANEVVTILEDIDLATLTTQKNPRTGKMVKTIVLKG